MIFKIFVWATIILVLPLILFSCLFIRKDGDYDHDNRYYRFLLNCITRIYLLFSHCSMELYGEEKLPKDDRFLLVCNRCSELDPLVISHALRKYRLSFAGPVQAFDKPIRGKLLRRCCFVPEYRKRMIAVENKIATLLLKGSVSMGVQISGDAKYEPNDYPAAMDAVKIAELAVKPIIVASIQEIESIGKETKKKSRRFRIVIREMIPKEEINRETHDAVTARIECCLSERNR